MVSFGIIYSTFNVTPELTLREKCPNTEFFLVRNFLYSNSIRNLLRKSPYSVRIQGRTDRKTPYLDTFHTVLM